MKLQRIFREWLPPGVPRWSAIITIVLLAMAWAIPPWRLAPLLEAGEIIPLHYNIYFGVDYLGAWQYVFALPAFATVVFILNTILSKRERRESKLVSDMLAITHVVVSLVVVTALFFVLLINV